MLPTTWSSSISKSFFMSLKFRGDVHGFLDIPVVGKKVLNDLKLADGVLAQLLHIGELAFVTLPFQFAQQRHEPRHAASRAGTAATVCQPPDFLRVGLNHRHLG